jgi:hypothetical protein
MNVKKNVGWKVDDAKAAKHKQGRHAQGQASGEHGFGSGIQNAFCPAKNSDGTDKLSSGNKIIDGFLDVLMDHSFRSLPDKFLQASAICATHRDFADLV